ncbi:MAG TPA: MFS transporter [Rhizomicrobium sp.]|nr:MFS transporter [Rhizomicrobium sp.]
MDANRIETLYTVMQSDSPVIYRARDVPLFLCCRFFGTVAMQVQSVAVGWRIYEITHNPLALGLVGLCQFVPMFAMTLPAGALVDRSDPRRVLSASLWVEALCGLALLAITHGGVRLEWPYYAVLLVFGAARGAAGPSSQSMMPFLVSREKLPRAIALNSSIFQVAVIIGPALGGFIYAAGTYFSFGVSALCFLLAGMGVTLLGGRRRDSQVGKTSTREHIAEGIAYVRARRVILGAISLDLFAVLLGGATALLPVYARDILHVGPEGLGLLRSAPALGAALTAISLAGRPLERRAGARMFATVAIFAAATIVFGLSKNFYLSIGALAVLGAADMVSVYVRHALVQFGTPDAMRGRVSAVSVLFIGASNELGEFESGVTAAWFGTVPAVVIGGIGTLLIVAIWMRLFPQLRRVDRLQDAAAV